MMLEQKYCTKCNKLKPFDLFNTSKNTKDRKHAWCKQCQSRYAKQRYNYSSDKQRGLSLKRKYGITIEEYNWILEKQENRCALCGTDVVGGNCQHFCVDHNHETGEVRGLLCLSCNTGLGNLKDSPKLLQRAIQYLEENGHYGFWED